MDICAFLTAHGIPFQRFDHVAVFRTEESAKLPPMPGAGTKNLFLRDEKGRRHFLLTVPHEKQVDLRALEPVFGVRRLGFASPERLQKYLGVTPGSVTILGLVNDTEHGVEFSIDEDLWNADLFQVHPLVNTATVVISKEGLQKFLRETGHEVRVIKVTGKEDL